MHKENKKSVKNISIIRDFEFCLVHRLDTPRSLALKSSASVQNQRQNIFFE